MFDRGERLNEFDRIPIVGTQLLAQEQNCYKLMLSIGFPGIFAGIERKMGRSYGGKDRFGKADIAVRRH